MPLVTVGLTHGLSILADLFAGEGRAVVVPSPFWGNYRQSFSGRTGARLLEAPSYRSGVFDPLAIAKASSGLPAGEPVLAILNHPSNPGGYSPTVEERRVLIESLAGEARRRPILAVCDDAYAGLVYEDGVPAESLFWDLGGLHDNLIPVKVDGATKELSFFGGRVGFLTFPFAQDSEVAAALESKVKCLLRATVGSPPAASQVVVAQALASPQLEEEVEEVRLRLDGRYRALRAALEATDRDLLRPLPFNSGCFALVELPADRGPSAEQVRHHLLEHHGVGLVSVGDRFLRIAFCSVRKQALPELVARLERAVSELQNRG